MHYHFSKNSKRIDLELLKSRRIELTLNGQFLHSSPLTTAVVGGQGVALDATACADTAGQHIVGVQIITTLENEG